MCVHLGLRPGKLRALSKKKHAGLQGGDAELRTFQWQLALSPTSLGSSIHPFAPKLDFYLAGSKHLFEDGSRRSRGP